MNWFSLLATTFFILGSQYGLTLYSSETDPALEQIPLERINFETVSLEILPQDVEFALEREHRAHAEVMNDLAENSWVEHAEQYVKARNYARYENYNEDDNDPRERRRARAHYQEEDEREAEPRSRTRSRSQDDEIEPSFRRKAQVRYEDDEEIEVAPKSQSRWARYEDDLEVEPRSRARSRSLDDEVESTRGSRARLRYEDDEETEMAPRSRRSVRYEDEESDRRSEERSSSRQSNSKRTREEGRSKQNAVEPKQSTNQERSSKKADKHARERDHLPMGANTPKPTPEVVSFPKFPTQKDSQSAKALSGEKEKIAMQEPIIPALGLSTPALHNQKEGAYYQEVAMMQGSNHQASQDDHFPGPGVDPYANIPYSPTAFDNASYPPDFSPNKRYRYYVRGDLIYWQIETGGLGFGNNSNSQDTITYRVSSFSQNPPGTENTYNLHFDWSPGYRIYLGTYFPNRWYVEASWTDIHSGAELNANGDNLNLNGNGVPQQAIKAANNFVHVRENWRVNYEHLTFDLGKLFYLGQKASIQTFVGLDFGWLNQDTFSKMSGTSFNPQIMPFDTRVHQSATSWYVGPRFGVNLDYAFARHFSFLTNIALAPLYVQTNLRQIESPKSGPLIFGNSFAEDRGFDIAVYIQLGVTYL